MKKNYETPAFEITRFDTEEVLLNLSVITGGGSEIRPGIGGGFLRPTNPDNN